MAIALRNQGADIIIYPSAFTVPTGMAHWEVKVFQVTGIVAIYL